jgi:cytochrome c peroxidase
VKGKAVSDGKEPSPLRENLIEGFSISDAQLDDLVAFLETLTDKDFLTNPKFSDPFATSR